MSDATILGFGCAVVFIAVAGTYVYMRECYLAAERAEQAKVRAEQRRDEPKKPGLKNVA